MSNNGHNFQHERSLSPAAYQRMIDKLGMSQAGAGRWLGVSERTARRMVSGDTEIPTAVVMLLHACVDYGISPIVPKKPRVLK